eukprot:350600-Chlamydomonas_euryale.AAC.4
MSPQPVHHCFLVNHQMPLTYAEQWPARRRRHGGPAAPLAPSHPTAFQLPHRAQLEEGDRVELKLHWVNTFTQISPLPSHHLPLPHRAPLEEGDRVELKLHWVQPAAKTGFH